MKTFSVKNTAKVYVYKEPVSMGYSFPKFITLVKENYNEDAPSQGDLFLFVNRKRSYIKVLFYHTNGYCIFAKTLPTGAFSELFETRKGFTLKELAHLIEHPEGIPGRKHLKRAA